MVHTSKMIDYCNMIIALIFHFITGIQSSDINTVLSKDELYDDGEPWSTTYPPNPRIDSERRVLWKHLIDSDYKCGEPRVTSCSWVHVNMNILMHQDWFYIPEEPFNKLKFRRTATWDLDGHYLTEFEYKGQFTKIIHAYFVVVYNDQRLFGNIECNGLKYTISSKSGYAAALKRWQNRWNEDLQNGTSGRTRKASDDSPLGDMPEREPM